MMRQWLRRAGEEISLALFACLVVCAAPIVFVGLLALYVVGQAMMFTGRALRRMFRA